MNWLYRIGQYNRPYGVPVGASFKFLTVKLQAFNAGGEVTFLEECGSFEVLGPFSRALCLLKIMSECG